MENIKIKETYLLLLIVIGLVSLSLYSTYALFTASTEITDVVGFETTLTTGSNILEYEMVTVPAGETKIIEVNITNSYESSLYYGAWYEIISPSDTSKINVGLYTEENATTSSGEMAAGTSLSLLVGIQNDGTEEAIVNIGTVGSLTSNLGLSDTRILIPAGWSPVTSDITLTEFTVDGTTTTTIPTTGTYTVNPNCTGATATYDYVNKKFLVSNISVASSASCLPSFTTTTRPTMANYIINLLGSNTSVSSTSNNDGSTLEKVNSSLDTGSTSTDYRYRGINPNNYIWFNDELWRIIGVFDQYSHGQTGTKLVKIIRNESIGAYNWNTSDDLMSDVNNWPGSDMYNLLNTLYYNSQNGTGTGYCFVNISQVNCNFTGIGLNEISKSMVKNVTWYLGGYSSYSVTTANMYKYERSTDTSTTYYYSGNAQTLTNTPIGLIYASDLGYAAPSTCTDILKNYKNTDCVHKNWLISQESEWMITHRSSTEDGVFYTTLGGYPYYHGSGSTSPVRPVLYLDSSVYYISGSGSITDPYIVGV